MLRRISMSRRVFTVHLVASEMIVIFLSLAVSIKLYSITIKSLIPSNSIFIAYLSNLQMRESPSPPMSVISTAHMKFPQSPHHRQPSPYFPAYYSQNGYWQSVIGSVLKSRRLISLPPPPALAPTEIRDANHRVLESL